MGPTAVGKTELAMRVTDALAADGVGVDLISVDAVQVYRGLNIGSAKPDVHTLQRYPHALIDVRSPLQTYDAWQFCQDALRLLRHARARRRIPLLVGGSMFYFNALLHGLDALPAADGSLREDLQQRAAEQGWPALHAALSRRDPAAAARINVNDAQRIARALEITLQAGGEESDRCAPSSSAHTLDQDWLPVKFVLHDLQRDALHLRIHRRTRQMLESGLLDEIRALAEQYDLQTLPASMRAVGYRQAWEVRNESLAESGLADIITAATRQLAKRQLTWLRNEAGAIWLDRQWKQCHTLVAMRVKNQIRCPISLN
jgi:tRNA dimethylallyltransferase